MKKVTVVRQNRCDKEMKLLLFGCFFFYFAMQLFVGVTDRPQLVNAINMALYLVFVPGFAFRTGYRFRTIQRLRSEEQGKKEIFGMALCSYAAFFVLAVLDGVARGGSVGHAFFNTLTLLAIPGSAAVFFMLALLLLLAGVFLQTVTGAGGKKTGNGDRSFGFCTLLFSEGKRRGICDYGSFIRRGRHGGSSGNPVCGIFPAWHVV